MADIYTKPTLDASKIISGRFDMARMPGGASGG